MSKPKNTKQESTNTDNSASADHIVEQLHKTDGKIERARNRLLSDPDTLSDKAVKSAVPAITGLIGGKAFQWFWDNTVAKNGKQQPDGESTHQQGLVMSIAFAMLSAAFGALLGELTTRGSQAFVTHRQAKRK